MDNRAAVLPVSIKLMHRLTHGIRGLIKECVRLPSTVQAYSPAANSRVAADKAAITWWRFPFRAIRLRLGTRRRTISCMHLRQCQQDCLWVGLSARLDRQAVRAWRKLTIAPGPQPLGTQMLPVMFLHWRS